MSSQRRLSSPYFRFGLSSTGGCTLSKEAVPENVRLIGNGQVGGKARGLIFAMDHMARGGVPSGLMKNWMCTSMERVKKDPYDKSLYCLNGLPAPV